MGDKPVVWAILWSALLVAGVGVIAVAAREDPRRQVGQRALQPATARVDFTAVDREATQVKRSNARSSVPNVYSPDAALYQTLGDRLTNLTSLVDQSFADLRPEALADLGLDRAGFEALQDLLSQPAGARRWEELKAGFLRELFSLAILSPPRFEAEVSGYDRIVLLHPDPDSQTPAELMRSPEMLVRASDREEIELRVRRAARNHPRPLEPVLVRLTMQAIQGPTYFYDPEATAARRAEAYAAVEPEMQRFSAGSVLVTPGQALDAAALDVLEAEREAYFEAIPAWMLWLKRLGVVGTAGLVAAGMWGYLLGYYRRVAENPMRGLAVTALLLLSVGVAVSVARFQPQLLYGATGFAAVLATMVFAIAYDQRCAVALGAAGTVLIMLALQLNLPAGVTLLAGVGLAAALLTEVRTRSKLVMVGLYSGGIMAAAAVITGVASRPLSLDAVLGGEAAKPFVVEQILIDAGVSGIAGLIAGFVVQGVLPGVEKLFRVTTAMTLKELNDASHPLLQRLAQEAPGTYQHSLRIADMAESAAEAIGADALACRVGAMYHDIGKMNKPGYFIENQGGGPNRHEKLSPAMSLLIIVGHVKDGVEMAREHNLPRVIRHFIESHHGTSLVQYFYHAAKKKTETAGQPGPSEFEFRYPGPKPQTREAAIMLLCDGIESAARTIEEPTPVRLEQLVHSIAIGRLMDGQFDECHLTLSELARIEGAITKTLCAVYHRRIKYPQADAPAPAQTSPATTAAATA